MDRRRNAGDVPDWPITFDNERSQRHADVSRAACKLERGEMALSQADGAVHAIGKPVEVETAILSGDPEQVLIDESRDADNDEVVHQAMEEGRLRNATVRQIDRRLDSWVRRYPDVRVQIVAAGTGVKTSENHSSAIDLAVVGRADADEISGLLTPNCHPILGYPDCSVLLVRH